jgi:predicted ATPase
MSKTKIYLSKNSDYLNKLDLDIRFPEAGLHPVEVSRIVVGLQGKSFCTHSQAIVNKFGCFVSCGMLRPADVEIYLIEKDQSISQHSFDKEGYLGDSWPVGYFEWQLS